MKKLIIALVLFAFVVLEPALAESKQKYCTKRQVRQVMEAACPGTPSNQKRSFFQKSDVYSKRDQYILWRRLFNIHDNATVTIPEASFQLSLLFGRCDEPQKQVDLKHLLEMYQQKNPQFGDHPIGSGFSNYDGSYEPPAMVRYRREITFTNECCDNPCSVPQIIQYCPREDV